MSVGGRRQQIGGGQDCEARRARAAIEGVPAPGFPSALNRTAGNRNGRPRARRGFSPPPQTPGSAGHAAGCTRKRPQWTLSWPWPRGRGRLSPVAPGLPALPCGRLPRDDSVAPLQHFLYFGEASEKFVMQSGAAVARERLRDGGGTASRRQQRGGGRTRSSRGRRTLAATPSIPSCLADAHVFRLFCRD